MMANLGDPNLIGGVLLCLGGLGLFLLGMVVLTDGLRALAGRALRRWSSSPTACAPWRAAPCDAC
jgi:Na+/phosphate symporter